MAATNPTPQQALDSGFGLRSTPSDVIAGDDLSGKLAVVTGGYSGLGLETTRGLAAAGADVIVPARRPDHAREVLAGLGAEHGVRAFAVHPIGRFRGVKPYAVDPANAERLWAVTAEVTGVDAFA